MRKTAKTKPHGKRYDEARAAGDRLTIHEPAEALSLGLHRKRADDAAGIGIERSVERAVRIEAREAGARRSRDVRERTALG